MVLLQLTDRRLQRQAVCLLLFWPLRSFVVMPTGREQTCKQTLAHARRLLATPSQPAVPSDGAPSWAVPVAAAVVALAAVAVALSYR